MLPAQTSQATAYIRHSSGRHSGKAYHLAAGMGRSVGIITGVHITFTDRTDGTVLQVVTFHSLLQVVTLQVVALFSPITGCHITFIVLKRHC